MKQVFLLAAVCAVLQMNVQAQSGIYESYAILSVNGSANKYYDMQASTGNTDFNGNNLGNFFPGSSLIVSGGQNKTFKCGGCDITNGFLQYRVYLTSGGPSGAFTGISMGFLSNDAGGCGGNQTWQGTGGSTNIIGGLSTPGNYTLEVYSTAAFQFCGSGTHFSNNGGANYRATFNYCNGNSLRTAASLDCETSVIPDYGNTFINNCGIIARVVPQGASPVNGTVTACVYTYGAAQRHPGSNSVYVQRVYDIEPATNAAAATARITLYYTQAELDAYDTELGYDAMPNGPADADLLTKKAFMVFTKYSNNISFGSFTDQGDFVNPDDADIVWNSSNNWWEISFDNAGFSEFYLHTGNSILNETAALLTGQAQANHNQINWMLSCGTDVKEVEVQRQYHNGAFETVSSYTGTAITCGRWVAYNDAAVTETQQRYRLQISAVNGGHFYSAVIAISRPLIPGAAAAIYPNPAGQQLTVSWQAATTGRIMLQVTNAAGRVVKNVAVNQVKGRQQQLLSIKELPSGFYMLTIGGQIEEGIRTFRFIKQ